MKTIYRVKRQKDLVYKYDEKILQVKLMKEARIDTLTGDWYDLIIVMKNGAEKCVNSTCNKEWLVKECNDINKKIADGGYDEKR